jgi:hypothetical protein
MTTSLEPKRARSLLGDDLEGGRGNTRAEGYIIRQRSRPSPGAVLERIADAGFGRWALGLAGLTDLLIGEEAVRLGERWRAEPSGAMLVWIGFAAGAVGVVCIVVALTRRAW